ncbi:hypothetical protein GCM10011507_11390 [Edaphobacter acidisoli]|uniref:CAAX prenyl protease 2/Lysostaphin resistance protein A-like domain-containing protein n=1 Tax=Edaphobacter acidisoli TaxID=2040573 RepID=A0A916W2T9_9BACT|nr:type II CAAX endopeptidase family protein [Edaphobacter acidisoli]GGA61595.1 hypothetical protein GCM10011507_11390 [Edaphobacter acidisoli]
MQAFDSTPRERTGRVFQFALFITSVAWVLAAQGLAARAASGISMAFDMGAERYLLSALFFVFLLWVGFSLLQAISLGSATAREVLGLPRRATSRREWAVGAAIGWGAVAVAVLPMALAGALHVRFWTGFRSYELAIINLLTLAAAALAEEVAFRGFPFRRLIEAIGPVKATIVMAFLFGAMHLLNPDATWISTLITMLAGVLLSIAWLRTRGLWLPWGLHFGWNASMGVLFGLPVSGLVTFSTVVQTRAIGREWLTGGDYGPEAALLTGVVLVVAMAVLVRATRDYAWHYTYEAPVPGGYPMEAKPPAVHAAMEEQARPGGLVQILPAPSGPPPTDETK